MTVEFLQCWALEVSKIEVVDSQVVDQQLGDLDQLLRYLRWLHNCFLPYEIDQVLGEGQDHHVEAWWCLEVVLRIVFFLLRKECCESEFLVIPRDKLDDAY